MDAGVGDAPMLDTEADSWSTVPTVKTESEAGEIN